MPAKVQCKNGANRVTPALPCAFSPAFSLALFTLVTSCVDNRNDVGYQLPASLGGSASSGGANATSGAAPETTLAPVPRLTGIHTRVSGDSVSIDVEPL